MLYKEEKRDLFSVSCDYYLAHCISRDAKMGAGIAKEFVKNYPRLRDLQSNWHMNIEVGGCMFYGEIFNLVTKERYWEKPTYDTLIQSLQAMKLLAKSNKIKRIAIPKIGCGLDKLEWKVVREIIKATFWETDIEILVCYID